MFQHSSASLVGALLTGWLVSWPGSCDAQRADWLDAVRPHSEAPASSKVTIAVLGDTPYGAEQVDDFPSLVAHINADPDVDRVVHLGDIGRGEEVCTDDYHWLIAAHFATFEDPLVYTPGDNEWTDCHRVDLGQHDPHERLSALRSVYFALPDVTLGGVQERVDTQANTAGFESWPENQVWASSEVVFATLHIVGSHNGLRPWFQDDETDGLEDDPVRRKAEVSARSKAAVAWIEATFERAEATKAQGVVLFMQADTWPDYETEAFREELVAIVEGAVAFEKPVLLVQGDTHRFVEDQPFVSGDAKYGIEQAAPNITRLVVEGETISEWLKLTVDPGSETVFSWERVFR